jgi:hypothetical protein
MKRALAGLIALILPVMLTTGPVFAHENGRDHWDGNVYHDYGPYGEHVDHDYSYRGHVDHDYSYGGHVDRIYRYPDPYRYDSYNRGGAYGYSYPRSYGAYTYPRSGYFYSYSYSYPGSRYESSYSYPRSYDSYGSSPRSCHRRPSRPWWWR